eukprot:SAG31_NODE_6321_length_2066_cov_7.228266_3_plen_65_part_00
MPPFYGFNARAHAYTFVPRYIACTRTKCATLRWVPRYVINVWSDSLWLILLRVVVVVVVVVVTW